MANIRLRERVRALRGRGYGINELADRTGVPKSTVSYWCRNIALSPAHMERLATKSRARGRVGMLRAAEKKRSLRRMAVEAEKRRGRDDVGRLSKRDMFILGLGLYWGEGYKSGNDECGLTNSNPSIIRAFIRWLNERYGVHASNLILRVSVNETHYRRIRVIQRYWSNTTGIPLAQFTKPSFIRSKSKKVYSNAHAHFGTLRIKVRRGTSLRRRILGSLEEIERRINA